MLIKILYRKVSIRLNNGINIYHYWTGTILFSNIYHSKITL